MTKIKSIPKADVEKLIAFAEEQNKKVAEIFDGGLTYSSSRACGYAEELIRIIVKKLKGEYPI